MLLRRLVLTALLAAAARHTWGDVVLGDEAVGDTLEHVASASRLAVGALAPR